jgi:hypothetical protein
MLAEDESKDKNENGQAGYPADGDVCHDAKNLQSICMNA